MQGVPDNSSPAKVAPQRNSELMSRLLSAAVLAVVALGLTYAGAWPFALLLAVFGGAMCWEWGRIVRGTSLDVPLAIHVLTMLLAIFAVLQLAAIVYNELVLKGKGVVEAAYVLPIDVLYYAYKTLGLLQVWLGLAIGGERAIRESKRRRVELVRGGGG